MKPPINGMTVIPFYHPQFHGAIRWQAFIDFLRYVLNQPDLVERIKKDLAIPKKETFQDKDLPRFADWVTINLWGTQTNRLKQSFLDCVK